PVGAGAAIRAVLAGGTAPDQQFGAGPGVAGELARERGLGHPPPGVGRRVVGDPAAETPQQHLTAGPDEPAPIAGLQAVWPGRRPRPGVAGRVVDPVGVDPLRPGVDLAAIEPL